MDYEGDASVESASEALSYRQRLEKPAGGEVVLMQWSPTMDLLAASFADNSVIVNRLSWQRVWSISAQNGTPTALVWRPDGKVLAIGRSDSSVTLVGMEHGHILHTHTLTHPITCLHWMTQNESSDVSDHHIKYEDRSLSYLPPLPSIEDNDSTTALHTPHVKHNIQPLSDEVDILLVGDKGGVIHAFVGGVLCVMSVNFTKEGDQECRNGHVILTCLSHDLKLLSTVSLASCSGEGKQGLDSLCLKTVGVALIYKRCRELQYLSLHYSHICCLLKYTSATLHCMHEAWEDLLLMVDAKLAHYSTTLKEGTTVADELLILLALGKVRSELQEFLVDELTAKGVRKIGLTLEMSYTRVRKYSFTCLSSVIEALQFHLSEVLGVARWKEQFGHLGISTENLQTCLNSLGTFALKNQELQSVIDECLKSMKAFFTWLYVVILKLGDETVPPSMKQQLNAEELKLVMHFLKKRLAKASKGSSHTFNLELIGQYLVNEDLKTVQEQFSPSFWGKLLQDADLDSNAIPWLFSPAPQKSLLQLLNSLTKDIDTAFENIKETISGTFVEKTSIPLLTLPNEANERKVITKLTSKTGEFVSDGRQCIYFPCDGDIVLLVVCGEQYRFCVRDVPSLEDKEQSAEAVNLSDVQVYNSETLSIMFQYKSSEREDVLYNSVAQLPVKTIIDLATDIPSEHNYKCCECHDVGYLLTQVHSLGPFHATRLAVSGPRRLAAVVSQRSKKIRLFDVDAEEDDEEEEAEMKGEEQEEKD